MNYHNIEKWSVPPAMSSITFTTEEANGFIYTHDDPLVVPLLISTSMVVHCILVDGGSPANILFMPKFEKMGLGK